MKVKELISILDLYNPDLEVCVNESTKTSISCVTNEIRHVMSLPQATGNPDEDNVICLLIDKIS